MESLTLHSRNSVWSFPALSVSKLEILWRSQVKYIIVFIQSGLIEVLFISNMYWPQSNERLLIPSSHLESCGIKDLLPLSLDIEICSIWPEIFKTHLLYPFTSILVCNTELYILINTTIFIYRHQRNLCSEYYSCTTLCTFLESGLGIIFPQETTNLHIYSLQQCL